jgi:hypothetical protein
MKLRMGFVSNSSSTSFSIYGAIIKEESEEKTFLDYYYGDPNYDDRIYIGLEYSSMKDDETKRQFKERIEAEVKRLCGNDIKCGSYEESYYNG